MNISNFVFFDETSTSNISNPFFNSEAGTITLQIDCQGSEENPVDLVIEWLNDLNAQNYHPISGIALDGLKLINNITSPGLYCFPCDGLYRIRMKSNGPVGNFKAYMIAVG